MQTTSRENAFDFLRLMAALAVVVQHAVFHLDAPFLWFSEDSGPWFYGGVSLFFVLSGFLVIGSAEKCHAEGRSWRDFYRNRALRIIPAIYVYFLAVVVLLLAIGVLAPGSLLSSQFAIFAASNVFVAPVYSPAMLDGFGVGALNGSLWTIPVEVSFYLVAPLIVLLAAKAGWKKALIALTGLAAAGLVLHGMVGGVAAVPMIWKLYGVTFAPFLWFFMIGIVWSKVWQRVKQSGWIALACLVAYFVVANLPHGGGAGLAAILSGIAAVPLSYAAIWFGYNAPKGFYRFTKWLGDLSFGTYIWHMVVVNVLIFFGARTWDVPGTLLTIGVVAVSMLVAYASWWLVEKPALAKKNYSLTDAKRSPSRT